MAAATGAFGGGIGRSGARPDRLFKSAAQHRHGVSGLVLRRTASEHLICRAQGCRARHGFGLCRDAGMEIKGAGHGVEQRVRRHTGLGWSGVRAGGQPGARPNASVGGAGRNSGLRGDVQRCLRQDAGLENARPGHEAKPTSHTGLARQGHRRRGGIGKNPGVARPVWRRHQRGTRQDASLEGACHGPGRPDRAGLRRGVDRAWAGGARAG